MKTKKKVTEKRVIGLKEINEAFDVYFHFLDYTDSISGEFYLTEILAATGKLKHNDAWDWAIDEDMLAYAVTERVLHSNRSIHVERTIDEFDDYTITIKAHS